jgi:hypothetical protein
MAETTSNLDKTDYDAIAAGRIENDPATAATRGELARRDNQPEETEHLKTQIEETRYQMSETIDALQEKLSFANLSEQVSDHVSNAIQTVKDSVYDATIGKAVGVMKTMGNGISDSGFVRTARKNPFPLILIGLGAGLLAYNSFSGRGRTRRSRQMNFQNFEGRPDIQVNQPPRLAEPQSTTGGLTDKVSNAANSAYEGVSGAMDTAYSSAKDIANRAYSKAGEFGTVAGDTYDRYLQENPLILGAAAFAVGTVVGLAIPSTRYEGELMGETRDELFRKAQDTGSTLIDKTKQIVDEAAQTVSKNTQAIIH